MTNQPSTVIENVEQLKEYLQVALQLEHATIPPYLTAAYTAKIEANKPSIDIIRTVAKEEMLHFTIAANLLNAIGGSPDLLRPDFVPLFPTPLPTGQTGFEVNIECFSEHAIGIFLDIERPAKPPTDNENVEHIEKKVVIEGKHLDESLRGTDDPFIPATKVGDDKYELHYKVGVVRHHNLSTESLQTRQASIIPPLRVKSTDETANAKAIELHFYSIGEFYKAIHLGFVELYQKMGHDALFCGDPKKQIGSKYFYSAGGELNEITDLNSALLGIDLIAGQGEGSHDRIYDDENELSHYFRFDQITKKRYYRVPDDHGGECDKPGDPRGGIFPVDMNAVFPIKMNAKIADYKGHPELEKQALLFNGQYKRFLEKLNEAFNGKPELLTGVFAAEMFRIKTLMERLTRNPIPGTNENAAPTFEMNLFEYPDAAS